MNYNCYYVYQYLDESGNPYYIGKGKDRRIDVVHKHTESDARRNAFLSKKASKEI